MKNLLTIPLFSLLLYGCFNAPTGNKNILLGEDTVTETYTYIPQKLNQKELNHYMRVLPQYFDSTLFRRGFNGGVMVVKGGNILFEKYSGYRDFSQKDPITDTTSFHIASISKTFTGMSVLRLVQKGLVDLNDSLGAYFPGFLYGSITVKDLLSHRSGLGDYVHFMSDKTKWDQQRFVQNNDVLQFINEKQPGLNYPIGRRFSYSNTNYVLLALLVEKVTGKSFPEFLKQEIFSPLKMEHTYVFTHADSARSTNSYKPNNQRWAYDIFEYTYGDKNIYTTPRDMMKWDQVLYNTNFIRQSLLDSAFSGYSFESKGVHNYGLGWRLLLLPNNKKVIYHFGRWHGFTPAFTRLTDEKVMIVILGNKFNKSVYTTAKNSYGLFGNYDRKGTRDDEFSRGQELLGSGQP